MIAPQDCQKNDDTALKRACHTRESTTYSPTTRLVEALVAGDEVAVPQQSDGHLRGQLEAVFPPFLAAPSHQARVVRGHEDVLECRWCRFVQRLRRTRMVFFSGTAVVLLHGNKIHVTTVAEWGEGAWGGC